MQSIPYAQVVADRCGERAKTWWSEAREALVPPIERAAFARVFAACGRWVGRGDVELSDDERDAIDEADLRIAEHWKVDDYARAALLLEAVELLPEEDHVDLIRELFLRGDTRERQAVLQTLSLLPRPVRFLDIAVEACRTNVRPVFEAIACENSYPADLFPELNFNQMVLKALFLEVPVARIEGLGQRVTPELVRMAKGYASERAAAGRKVPTDIDLIVSEAAS